MSGICNQCGGYNELEVCTRDLQSQINQLRQERDAAWAEIAEAKRVALIMREQNREGFERLQRRAEDISHKVSALLSERDMLRQQLRGAKVVIKALQDEVEHHLAGEWSVGPEESPAWRAGEAWLKAQEE